MSSLLSQFKLESSAKKVFEERACVQGDLNGYTLIFANIESPHPILADFFQKRAEEFFDGETINRIRNIANFSSNSDFVGVEIYIYNTDTVDGEGSRDDRSELTDTRCKVVFRHKDDIQTGDVSIQCKNCTVGDHSFCIIDNNPDFDLDFEYHDENNIDRIDFFAIKKSYEFSDQAFDQYFDCGIFQDFISYTNKCYDILKNTDWKKLMVNPNTKSARKI